MHVRTWNTEYLPPGQGYMCRPGRRGTIHWGPMGHGADERLSVSCGEANEEVTAAVVCAGVGKHRHLLHVRCFG